MKKFVRKAEPIGSEGDAAARTLVIGMRSLIFAASVLLVLLVLTGLLARTVPPGSYERSTVDGRTVITEGSFTLTGQPPLPVWRWFTAPFEVLAGPDSVMLISILLFMLLIAGAVSVMQAGGILTYLITVIIGAFSHRPLVMQAAVILVFMLFGSILGSMEEVVVLVPIVAALALRMGWDKPTGLGLSLGAIGLGFAAAISNPFTIGVAQKLADLPVFSGAWLRILIFIVVYGMYVFYVARSSRGARKQMPAAAGPPGFPGEKPFLNGNGPASAQPDLPSWSSPLRMRRSLTWFVIWMGIMVILIMISSRIAGLSDYLLPAVLLCFLAGGIGAGFLTGLPFSRGAAAGAKGIAGIAPGIVLVLLAAGIKHILIGSGVMDTLLYRAALRIAEADRYGAVLMIFALVLALNFFISSGSAKAFLIIPITAPLADMVGLSRQSAVLAYMFGDGFSNIIYPTNALLLICLAITGISYGSWFRWIWKLEALLLTLSVLFLLLAVRIGY